MLNNPKLLSADNDELCIHWSLFWPHSAITQLSNIHQSRHSMSIWSLLIQNDGTILLRPLFINCLLRMSFSTWSHHFINNIIIDLIMCMNNHDFPPILSGLFNFARFLGSNDNGETLQLDTLISINSIVSYSSTTIKVFRLSKTYPGSLLKLWRKMVWLYFSSTFVWVIKVDSNYTSLRRSLSW